MEQDTIIVELVVARDPERGVIRLPRRRSGVSLAFF
jgi:hypothetical protein